MQINRCPLPRSAVIALAALVAAAPAVAADRLLERHIDDRYHVLVQFTGAQMQRHIWPKFPIGIELTGSDGRTYTMRQPFELYSETRTYGTAATLDAAYDDAYAALVANGECLPVYAAFREASFDCGEHQGMRTVALRTDQFGAYLSTEMVASDLVPDESEFASARAVLDSLTNDVPGAPAVEDGSVDHPPGS